MRESISARLRQATLALYETRRLRCQAGCIDIAAPYTDPVPKLWNETIEAHRRAVRDAILNSTAELAAEHGVRSVTMSQIAERAGIGRATLYKYFSDVETILLGNLAVYAAPEAGTPGKKVEWNAKEMKATNAPELAHIVRREYRNGYSL